MRLTISLLTISAILSCRTRQESNQLSEGDQEIPVVAATFDSGFSDGLARVKIGEGSGFVDKSGNVVFTLEATTRNVFDFREGMVGYRSNKGWGFLDRSGKEVIPAIYNVVGSFADGTAIVLGETKVIGRKLVNYWGVIDKSGRFLLKPTGRFSALGNLSEGLRVAVNEGGRRRDLLTRPEY